MLGYLFVHRPIVAHAGPHSPGTRQPVPALCGPSFPRRELPRMCGTEGRSTLLLGRVRRRTLLVTDVTYPGRPRDSNLRTSARRATSNGLSDTEPDRSPEHHHTAAGGPHAQPSRAPSPSPERPGPDRCRHPDGDAHGLQRRRQRAEVRLRRRLPGTRRLADAGLRRLGFRRLGFRCFVLRRLVLRRLVLRGFGRHHREQERRLRRGLRRPGGAGSTPSCQASQLGYSWAGTRAAPSGGGQKQAVVALTNKSGHACALHGFPGVDLVNGGEQWSLQRSGTTPQPVTVAAGASAHFTITYLAWQKGDSAPFQPTTVVITAPNQRTSYDLPWRFGAVLKQDGATHPGTFVGPVDK
ncbi:DUF4232 domain-containing protein [Streptomyces sp. NPDC048045]|uniref:DUF4232 domain-containing protein n=1 Tax=Streptomyces sp. NPDC048045 TaxID=3154710 RepID=UPI00343FF7AD